LSGQPPSGKRAMALPMVEVETSSPNSSWKASRCSSRVRSSLVSRCFGSHSSSIIPFMEGLPGIALGSTSPVSRPLLSQRFMVGIDTEKVFVTSCLGLPASTAERVLGNRVNRLIWSGSNAHLLTSGHVRFDKYSHKFIQNSSLSYRVSYEKGKRTATAAGRQSSALERGERMFMSPSA
jgi:hypothetical protein